MTETQKSRSYRKRLVERYECHCCRKEQQFCWTCACGFQICLRCMQENQWGISGNSITWICPDCGELRGI